VKFHRLTLILASGDRDSRLLKTMQLAKTLFLATALIVSTGSASIQRYQAEARLPARRDARVTRGEDKELARISQAVEAKLKELRSAAEFPGATVGFVLPDGRYASVSVGVSDLVKQTPLKPNDRMLAGSIGKTYVAAVVLQLAEEGKINLDEKIEHWFQHEAWFGRLPNAKEITLRMLMNHTSGIPSTC
jgi:CubicO group peptidase (beta-lactamase class C family)